MPRRAGCGGSSRPTSPTWPACRRSFTASSAWRSSCVPSGSRRLALGPTLLAGVLTLSLLILPIIVITTQEALRAVPQSLRQAALALGATRWQVVRDHVLPSALPGILTGTILGLSRAIGETAPLLMVGAAGSILQLPKGPLDRYSALPVEIYNYAKEPDTRVPDRRRRRHPDPGDDLALDERHRHRDSQPLPALSLERLSRRCSDSRWSRSRTSTFTRPLMSVSETRADRARRQSTAPRPQPRPRQPPGRRDPIVLSTRGLSVWYGSASLSRTSRSTSRATRSPPRSARRAAARAPCSAASTG